MMTELKQSFLSGFFVCSFLHPEARHFTATWAPQWTMRTARTDSTWLTLHIGVCAYLCVQRETERKQISFSDWVDIPRDW